MRLSLLAPSAAALALATAVPAWAGDVYYECPGNVFTNTITAQEAATRGCKAREAQRVTTIEGPRVSRGQGQVPAKASGKPAGASPETARVAAAEQQSRDSDAKRILGEELAREEAALEALRKDYNGGQPERRGDERNFQKYAERVAEMKLALERKEADVAAIKREIGKLQ